MIITVEHKHCKCTRVITGANLYDAYKNNGLDMSIWNAIDIEELGE
jgi:hypothetical protein